MQKLVPRLTNALIKPLQLFSINPLSDIAYWYMSDAKKKKHFPFAPHGRMKTGFT